MATCLHLNGCVAVVDQQRWLHTRSAEFGENTKMHWHKVHSTDRLLLLPYYWLCVNWSDWLRWERILKWNTLETLTCVHAVAHLRPKCKNNPCKLQMWHKWQIGDRNIFLKNHEEKSRLLRNLKISPEPLIWVTNPSFAINTESCYF